MSNHLFEEPKQDNLAVHSERFPEIIEGLVTYVGASFLQMIVVRSLRHNDHAREAHGCAPERVQTGHLHSSNGALVAWNVVNIFVQLQHLMNFDFI